MNGLVVDASVVVKWLVQEDLSDEAASLLVYGASLAVPALLFAEAGNALWAVYRRGDLTEDDMADAVDTLRSANFRSAFHAGIDSCGCTPGFGPCAPGI